MAVLDVSRAGTKALILKAAHFEHSNAGSSLSTVYRKHTFVRYYELSKKQGANIILLEISLRLFYAFGFWSRKLIRLYEF